MKKCMGCMRDYRDDISACPVCGYSAKQMEEDRQRMPDAIPPETILYGRFIIGRVLSMTNYSIIYLSWDALMQRRLVIREFFPYGFARRGEDGLNLTFPYEAARTSFLKGKDVFIQEGLALSKNQDLQDIVHIYRVFEENGTAYQVMQYLEGCTLQDYFEECGAPPGQKKAYEILEKLAAMLEHIHSRGLIHYNLSPENVYIDEEFNLTAIDFSLGKWEWMKLAKGKEHELDLRYCAPEVLEGQHCGAGADMYSLGAIFYRMLKGNDPPQTRAVKQRKRKWEPDDPLSARILRRLMEPDPVIRAGSLAQAREVAQETQVLG